MKKKIVNGISKGTKHINNFLIKLLKLENVIFWFHFIVFDTHFL